MEYSFQAVDETGELHTGNVQAENDRHANRVLQRKGLAVIKLEIQSAKIERKAKMRIRSADLALAFYEIVVMLKAGISIVEAVESQAKSSHSEPLQINFEQVAQQLRRGESFSSALRDSDITMPEYVYQLIEAGEMTGKLGESMADAVAQMEYEQFVRREIRGALTYPLILLLSGLGAVFVLFVFVVPNFTGLLSENSDIPLIATIVLTLGAWCNKYSTVLLIAVLAIAFGAIALLQKDTTRKKLFNFAAALPLIGSWLNESEIARWSKVLAALLSNRVPLLKALQLANNGIVIEQRALRMHRVARAVENGETLAQALEQNDALVDTGNNLISVGERSGELPTMLESLAKLYDDRGRARMKQILTLIEPIAILAIGAVVGFIMAGIILAITSANNVTIS